MEETTFYRPARAYPPILARDEIVVSAPPVVQPLQGGALNWLRYALPAVGGLGSLIFILAYHTSLLLVIAGILISLCAVMSGVLIGALQQRQVRKQRQRQSASYLEYLAQLKKHLVSVERDQRQVDSRLFPTYTEMANRVEQRDTLWERRPVDADFLRLRVGTGPGPLSRPMRLDIDSMNYTMTFIPELRARAEALINQFNYLNDLAATINLRACGVLTISGQRAMTGALARALLCQIAAFHAPEDVRCVIYFPPQHAPEWEWSKWLPHGRCLRKLKTEQLAPEPICMLATTIADLQQHLQMQIEPELERRRRLIEEESPKLGAPLPAKASLPHIVMILDDFSPQSALGQLPELRLIFNESAALGVTVICLCEERRNEPTQMQARLAISAGNGLSFAEIKNGGRRLEGLIPDGVAPQICERLARSMSPLTIAEAGATSDLSQDVRLLDLLNIPSADMLDPTASWRTRSRADFLRVPISLCASGRILYLDLKEAADGGMGPHGLIVGATGSGKSELLRTLIAALAITHDPRQLNFVLIDFKGGASFADFVALPHVAGVVTNLQSDISLVHRVYASLLGEQQRRQRMLHEAGNLDNIKQYQSVQQANSSLAPMPHLLIIVDEFAELLASRPDFLDLFVTLGRVGRSLGVHLLFSTQRLEEGRLKGLESHLRYRICLRTFSAMESKTVLGKPDAYYLPSIPGMGYFKGDADTLELFKAALISIPYLPHKRESSVDELVRIFTPAGKLQRLHSSSSSSDLMVDDSATKPSDLHTEMDVIIQRLDEAGQALHLEPIHQVWLPPLAPTLALGQVLQQCQRPDIVGSAWETPPPFGELRIPVGLIDQPLLQTQEPLWLDFTGIGGHLALVGAPQVGKSTFLRTLVTAFLLTHSPHEVQMYAIDMGGGQLRIFEQAPHVGAVCSKVERDKVTRVMRQMRKILEERELLFRERGIDSMATFRAQRQRGEFADIPFGDVFLVIDNFAQFYQEFDQFEPELIEIATSGLTFGVHLIVTTNRWAEIRAKLRDNIGTRLELRLNDPMESELGRAVAATIPVGMPGRGIDKEKLSFQIALPIIEYHQTMQASRNQIVQEALQAIIQRVGANWHGDVAPQVHMLPALVMYDQIPPPNKQAGIPLGLEEFHLNPYFIDLIHGDPHCLIVGDAACGKTSLLRLWLRGIEQGYPKEEAAFAIVDFHKNLLDFTESDHLLTFAYNMPTLTACIGNLKFDLDQRLQKISEASLSELRKPQQWAGRHYFLIVDDAETIMSSSGNPLSSLADLVSSGHEIGFHLVLARRSAGMGRALFEPLFQHLRDMGTPFITMSGEPGEGKIFYGQGAVTLPPGRGQLLQPKHAPLLIQTAFAQPQYAGE